MVMKKIKPQYGKVAAPVVNELEDGEIINIESKEIKNSTSVEEKANFTKKSAEPKKDEFVSKDGKNIQGITSEPNPFMQTKEVFGKARLTKIGYRMRTDYVEILDIIKKIKKGGYTLEAVLDDALTYYFENSEDGKEALKKAEIFYS